MLNNEIVTFAALAGNLVLGFACWKQWQLSLRITGEYYGAKGKSIWQPSAIEFELPGMPPLPENEPVEPPPPPRPPPPAANQFPILQRRPRNMIRERVFVMPPHVDKTCVSAGRAAELLIEYMNAENLTGLYTANEIDGYWELVVELYDLEHLAAVFVREALRKHCVGQKRLNTPQYLEIRQRSGQPRAVLYRIPKCRVAAGANPSVPADYTPAPEAISALEPGKQPASKPAASHPANRGTIQAMQKPNENRVAA